MNLRNALSASAAAIVLAGASGSIAVAQTAASQTQPARQRGALPPSAASAQPTPGEVAEVVVTANKREQNLQDVAASVTAASGATLQKLGIVDTADLQKITPGFLATPSFYGTEVYTIRGVGFQDTSLAGSPTVSTYVDEAPLPYAALTPGASLDLDRVEVLKGPQGTLFGENATGGAVNYIASKPTGHLEYGGDLSVGRFSSILAQAYVGGPLASGLEGRLALQSNTGGPWQKGYGPQLGLKNGSQDFTNGRLSLLWKPTDRLRSLLTVSGWTDKSDNQAAQHWGASAQVPGASLAPAFASYPLAPHNDQAAGWSPCINISPYDPIAGQEAGVTYPTPSGRRVSQGPGSVVQAGGQPTQCAPMKRDNSFIGVTLRSDYDIGDDLKLTALTSYLNFSRRSALDGDGTPIQDAETYQTGRISSFYQELRLTGRMASSGNWIVGANYQHDSTVDQFLATFGAITSEPFVLAPGVFYGLGPVRAYNAQRTNTYAAYANVEYPLLENLTVIGGVRYTQQKKDDRACTADGGDGSLAGLAAIFGSANPGANGCFTLDARGQAVKTPYAQALDEDNVSWRAGLNYKPAPDTLLYVNVSKGYKGGSFPTITFATSTVQLKPVVQESLLSYEVGFKSRLFERQLTLDAAAFYYDYKNKQILGTIADPIFGVLSALVNVPQSHVEGFEASATWAPNSFPGLTVSPSASYQKTRIDGCSGSAGSGCVGGGYFNTDDYGNLVRLTGQPFPSAPEWQAAIDVEYDWSLGEGLTAYVGAHVAYTGSTNAQFDNPRPLPGQPPLSVPSYTLVDLRAGVSKDNWAMQVWGRNVADQYYWTAAYHVADGLIRYAGMPATYGVTLSYHFR